MVDELGIATFVRNAPGAEAPFSVSYVERGRGIRRRDLGSIEAVEAFVRAADFRGVGRQLVDAAGNSRTVRVLGSTEDQACDAIEDLAENRSIDLFFSLSSLLSVINEAGLVGKPSY